MIVVYVEHWPNGDQEKARPVGSLGIHDISMPGELLKTYSFEMDEAPNPALNIEQLQKKGQILAYNRNQSVWKLIRRAIDTIFPPLVT